MTKVKTTTGQIQPVQKQGVSDFAGFDINGLVSIVLLVSGVLICVLFYNLVQRSCQKLEKISSNEIPDKTNTSTQAKKRSDTIIYFQISYRNLLDVENSTEIYRLVENLKIATSVPGDPDFLVSVAIQLLQNNLAAKVPVITQEVEEQLYHFYFYYKDVIEVSISQ